MNKEDVLYHVHIYFILCTLNINIKLKGLDQFNH